LVGKAVVHAAKVPLPPKLTSLPLALVGVLPLAFQVASGFVAKPSILKKPLALGTRARNDVMDEGFRVIVLVPTLAQSAFVSPALVAARMMMP
jgi:hypothetical protein